MVALLLLTMGATSAGAWLPSDFEVEGRQALRVLSLDGRPESPAAGDVVRHAELPFVLDGPGVPTTRYVADEGRLYADSRLLGVVVTEAENPLETMPAAEARMLRGVRLETWSDAVRASLAKLDLERTCIFVSKGAAVAAGHAVPDLPVGVRYLCLADRQLVKVDLGDGASTFELDPGFRALDGLRRLTRLEFLQSRLIDLDLALLEAARELRVLDLDGATGRLPPLPELRHLEFGWAKEAPSLDALGAATKLRLLFCQGTSVADLIGLDEYPDLVELDIRRTGVTWLPGGRLPHLEVVRALATRIPAEDEASFRALNPTCALKNRYLPALLEAVRGANRIELQRPSRFGDVVHTVEGEAEVSAFIALIEIDDARSGGYCMCSGNADLWFYKDDDSLVLMSLHHGLSLRWTGWPGDAALTPASGRAISRKVAEWGLPSAFEEVKEREAREHLSGLREGRVAGILPASIMARLREAKSEEEAIQAFVAGMPDAVQRAAVLLRLIGLDERTWSRLTPLDQLVLEELLPGLNPDALGAAARDLVEDPDGLRGLGCWLFEWRKADTLPADVLESILPAVARNALSHPRADNRRRALHALAALGTEQALQILVGRIKSDAPLRTIPEGESLEPLGWVRYITYEDELQLKCGDAALAAALLARLAHRPASKAIEARLADPDVEDREVLQAALNQLAGREGTAK